MWKLRWRKDFLERLMMSYFTQKKQPWIVLLLLKKLDFELNTSTEEMLDPRVLTRTVCQDWKQTIVLAPTILWEAGDTTSPFPRAAGPGFVVFSQLSFMSLCEWNRLACWVLNLVSFTWFNAPKIHLPIPVPCWLGVIWMDKHLLSNKRSRAGGSTHHLDCSGSCSQVSALVTSHAASGMWLTRCCWGGLKFQTN